MKKFYPFFLSVMGFFLFPYLSWAVAPRDKSIVWNVINHPFRPLYFIHNTSDLSSKKIEERPLWSKTMPTETMVQRAWITSMVVPGLGQIYNKDYWKVPCLYLGFALVGYKIYSEHQQMHKYNRTLLFDANNQSERVPAYTKKRIRECERTRDLFIIIASAWYILNIFDAYAGAHDKTVNFIDDIGTTSTDLRQNNHLK
ncbi:DUF5683 domain-containing protein [Candidatus Cardinium hertigii]|uniref:DUF5683 domain-containing protein n=1 Tax=Candidatus Cardinium hertigii TaxID=247481 RepID=UPI003D7ECE06